MNDKSIKHENETMCVLDFETTGLMPTTDEIIETCLKIYQKNIQYNSLSKPDKVGKCEPGFHGAYILPKITEITGITNQMIHNKGISQKLLAKDIFEFLQNNDVKYIVAHNGEQFDFIFLKLLFIKYGYDYKKFSFIDTIQLLKNIDKIENVNRPSYSQKNICLGLNIKQQFAHRAYGDVYDLENIIDKTLTNHSLFKNQYINYNYHYIYKLCNSDLNSDKIINYIKLVVQFFESESNNLLIENIHSKNRLLLYNWIEININNSIYGKKLNHQTNNNNLMFFK